MDKCLNHQSISNAIETFKMLKGFHVDAEIWFQYMLREDGMDIRRLYRIENSKGLT